MTSTPGSATGTRGHVLHSLVRYYDLLATLLTHGRERALRERLVALAGIVPGHAVLDVGCGTGSLALAARRRVGPTGTVRGIDASPEMIARARRKAARAGLAVAFDVATVESLPFADARFDVVLSTLMLHHLPKPARLRCVQEMRRVTRPGGRLLVVDFAPVPGKRSLMARLHRHGHVNEKEVAELFAAADVSIAARGAVGMIDLHYTLGVVPDRA